jgi:hypothetical protein
MSGLTMVPESVLSQLADMEPNLQDVMARTRAIELALRRMASSQARDRAPLTINAATPAAGFSADPAVPGGEVTAGAGPIVLCEYEVPEHRMGEVYHLDITMRIIVVLGAAQSARITTQAINPSGQDVRIIRQQHAGPATGAGQVINISSTGSHWYTPRWKIQCVAELTAGAGVARAVGHIGALEYNLLGD